MLAVFFRALFLRPGISLPGWFSPIQSFPGYIQSYSCNGIKRIIRIHPVMTSHRPLPAVAVNGEDLVFDEGSTVMDILVSKGFDPSRVAVEMDGRICPRAEFPTRRILGGERMEIVSFVGGG